MVAFCYSINWLATRDVDGMMFINGLRLDQNNTLITFYLAKVLMFHQTLWTLIRTYRKSVYI